MVIQRLTCTYIAHSKVHAIRRKDKYAHVHAMRISLELNRLGLSSYTIEYDA
jgi:hypothetical protein